MTAEVLGTVRPIHFKPKLSKSLMARQLNVTKRTIQLDINCLTANVPKSVWGYKLGQEELTETQAKILTMFRHFVNQTRSREAALYHLSEELINNGI